jgi:hypothetical protein
MPCIAWFGRLYSIHAQRAAVPHAWYLWRAGGGGDIFRELAVMEAYLGNWRWLWYLRELTGLRLLSGVGGGGSILRS